MHRAASFDTQAMVADLAALTGAESPSRDVDRLTVHARLISGMMVRLLGSAPRLVDSPVGPHIHWTGGGEPRVLILGHHDTVHPAGTLTTRPFAVEGDVASGPGVFDMKAGIVQAVHAVAALADRSHVEILLSCDEEIGSRESRALIEERAAACGAVLVIEPSADGGVLKTGRKGTGTFEVRVHGRASHAGLEPEKGINSLVELAHLIPQIVALADDARGTTVTPTLAAAGTADNVVPESAVCAVDVRVAVPGEKERVEAAMAALRTTVPGARVEVTGGIGRPPMHESVAAVMLGVAAEVAAEAGLPAVEGVTVGGGSDGNFTAALGVHTLDGLGAVGGGAHGASEHVLVSRMADRAALLAGLCQRLSSMASRFDPVSVPADR